MSHPPLPTPAEVHALAVEKGWYEGVDMSNPPADWLPARLALVHAELSEALEEYRQTGLPPRGKITPIVTELADAVIRIFDISGALDLPIIEAIAQKHQFNATRPHRHGGKVV